MPKIESFPPGAPCWIELHTSDPDRSLPFYSQLFGWETSQGGGEEAGGYIDLVLDGTNVGGCMRNEGTGAPDGWLTYLATADVDAVAAATPAKGGTVVVEPRDVLDLGKMAFVAAPGGGGVGVWQPGTLTGFEVHGEPGTPYWFELHTPDYDGAVAFYRDVLGWDTHTGSDEPEFRYTTLGTGEHQLAGIMDAAAFLPPGAGQWSIYFTSPDVDASLRNVLDLGGTVVRDAEDTPYGRLAEAQDPTGVSFKLATP